MKARWSSLLGLMLIAASASALNPGADVSRVTSLANRADPGGPTERRLGELTRDVKAGKVQLAQLSQEADAAHARIVARGRLYVRWARAGLLPASGGFDALVDHAVRLERLRNELGRDLALEHAVDARRLTLGKQQLDEEAQRSALEVEVQAMAVARTALLSEQDRSDAFARAFASSVGSAHTAVYGAGVGPSDPSAASGGFGTLKGRLPFPLTGRSEIRVARRPGSEGPGLEMFAPPGAAVRAVQAGRVAFADSYSAYGRTVILDHGGGYYTVSANLGSIEVKTGDDVPAGARIGTVGECDAAGVACLYFEIRSGTRTVPPAEWFGI